MFLNESKAIQSRLRFAQNSTGTNEIVPTPALRYVSGRNSCGLKANVDPAISRPAPL